MSSKPPRILTWLAAAAAVVCAAGLVLFARDLRSWPPAVARGDVHAGTTSADVRWRPATVLPTGWSEGMLGASSQLRLRLAIERFRQTYNLPPGFESGVAAVQARDAAEASLAAAAQGGTAPEQAQALDLLGLLYFGDSSAGGGSAAAVRAVADLQQAVSTNPADEEAKSNLELVLALLQPHGKRAGSSSAAGPRSTGRHGSGSGTPGEGY